MGIDAVVIVENSNHITLDTFRTMLLQDNDLARLVWNSPSVEFSPWQEFEWRGKKYFSWLCAPRMTRLDFYVTSTNPTDTQIIFFRCMHLVEQVAGGPIYVGNDLIYRCVPDEFPSEDFVLPPPLDSLCWNWRDLASTSRDRIQPSMIQW